MRFSDNNGGSYQLTNFPGNSQIAVLNADFIAPDKRGKGLGKQLHEDKLNKAIELGYDMIVCTVITSNVAQVKILLKYGWTKLSRFNSKKTGNDITMFSKQL